MQIFLLNFSFLNHQHKLGLFANLNGVRDINISNFWRQMITDDDLFKQICFQQLAQYDSAF